MQIHGLDVCAKACPLRVHLVEEGLAQSAEAEVLVRHSLRELPNIDTLLLGCTQYHRLAQTIRRVAGNSVVLAPSAAELAREVRRPTGNEPSLAESRSAEVIHFVTGDIAADREAVIALTFAGLEAPYSPDEAAPLARRAKTQFPAPCGK